MILDHHLDFQKFIWGTKLTWKRLKCLFFRQPFEKKFKADLTETMKFTSRKTLEELPDVPAPSYSRIKCTLYRLRALISPLLLESLEGIKLSTQWKNTKSEKRFFREKDKFFGPLVLSTDKMLEALSNSKIFLCDEFFKCAPKPFQQLFTWR